MTIEKHGNKWRIRERYKGKLYMISVPEKPTQREAQRLIDEKINTQSNDPKTGMTMRSAGNAYIELKNNILSPSSIIGYKSIMRNLSESFMSKKISDITALDVQKEINDYSAKHSSKSTRNVHGFISAVLGTYKPSLQLHTSLPQKAKFEPNTPSEDEVKRILNAASGTRYEVVFRLGCYGMRRGEICAIKSSDLSGNMLRINKAKVKDGKVYIIRPMPKTTESNREIYVDDTLAEMIRNANGEVYPGDPDRINKKLTELQKALGIKHFRFHDLRAYYASMAHALGVPDAYIMANGGWSSTRIMDRVYKRAFADKQAEMNKAIAEHLGG